MKFRFRNFSIGVATVFLLSSAYAEVVPTAEMAKLSNPQILTIAKSGKSQELTVEFEATSINQELASKRSAISANEDAGRKAKTDGEKIGINNDIFYNNNVAEANYVSELASLKSSVLSPLAPLGVSVIQDYSHSSIALVKVPGLEALEALLKNPLVLKVHATESVKVSANWPSNYSDLAIINSTAANQSGYTGKDQMVGILDTGVDESLIPAIVGGANRIYNIGPLNPCTTGARPNPAGMNLGCPDGDWQHGTLNAQIIAAVAPNA